MNKNALQALSGVARTSVRADSNTRKSPQNIVEQFRATPSPTAANSVVRSRVVGKRPRRANPNATLKPAPMALALHEEA